MERADRTTTLRPAVALLSGGMDSATVLGLAREQGFTVHALTVSYGQRHVIEVERAAELAKELGAHEHRIVELDLRFAGGSALTDHAIDVPKNRPGQVDAVIPPTYVPARNTVFLALGLAWAEALGAVDMFIGVNAVDYSGYPDCRPEFLAAFERLATCGTRSGVEGRPVRVHAPLLQMTKAEIVNEAVRLGVNLSRTVSCYDPDSRGAVCGSCDACVLRAKGFREAGLPDPASDYSTE